MQMWPVLVVAARDIIQNAIDLYTQTGFGKLSRVAILSAVEAVTPRYPVDDRGGGTVQNGRSRADHRRRARRTSCFRQCDRCGGCTDQGIRSDIAGRAQILLVPDLEAGNMLAKNLAYFAKADSAVTVLGARVPVVLTPRADSARARMTSCAVAALYANARRQPAPTIAA